MRRAIAAGTGASLVGILLAGSAPAGDPSSGEPPSVDCESRTQVIGRAPPADRGDLKLGRVFFSGLRHTGRTAPASDFEPERGERFATVKAPPVVDAGAAATLAVPTREAGRFEYEIARDRGPHAAGPEVELVPCPSDAEVAGRPVGPRTPFVGGIRVSGPGCYRLRARVDGREPVTRRVKLGVEGCG